MKNNLKIWVRALRLPFLTVTIVPITLGAVIAWSETGNFNWQFFLLTLIGGIFVHLGLNLCNDYFDHISGNDESNPNPTPFSGGSRVIQEGLIPADLIFFMSVYFFIAGASIGLYLNYVTSGNVILIIGIIGFVFAIFYTAPPLKLGYRGGGEIFTGLGFGPLMVMGSYYVQRQSLSINPLCASVPVGILVALILYVNEFPDYAADFAVNKRTIVVIKGKKGAMKLFPFILLSSYLVILIGVVFNYIPVTSLIVLLTLPLAIKVVVTLKKNYEKIYKLLPANAGMIKLHLVFGLLLIISYMFDKTIK